MLRPCFSVNTGEMFTLQQTLSHAVSNIFFIFFSPSFLKHPFNFYCDTAIKIRCCSDAAVSLTKNRIKSGMPVRLKEKKQPSLCFQPSIKTV